MRDNYATEPHYKREVIDVPIHNRRPAIDRLQTVVFLQGGASSSFGFIHDFLPVTLS